MKEITLDLIINAYKRKNYKIWKGVNAYLIHKPYDLNIFGIRSNNLDQSKDQFDDVLGVFYTETRNNFVLKTWVGTTDPGKYFLNKPMNSAGTFIMIPGQYRGAYSIGKHHAQDALVQIGSLKGYRDTNKDNILDLNPNQIYNGSGFGVNIHHKENDSETIGLGSAGCQVFKHTNEHKELMGLCHKAEHFWGNSFTYTLLTEDEVFNF